MQKINKITHWLVIFENDIEPRLKGPFKNDRTRVVAARDHRKSDIHLRDGLFRLDINQSGSPRISHFISREVESEISSS